MTTVPSKSKFSFLFLLGFLFLFAGIVILLDQLNLIGFWDIEPFRFVFIFLISIGSVVAGVILIFKKSFVKSMAHMALRKGL